MKKVLFISLMSVAILLTGCLYTPATYVPTSEEQEVLNAMANDSTTVEVELNCVALTAIDATLKASFVDTVSDFLAYEIDTLGTTVADTLNNSDTLDVAVTADKIKVNLNSAHLSGYAKIEVPADGTFDFYMDMHGEMSIRDTTGAVVDFDEHSMSSAAAMYFKLYSTDSVIREHYIYTLEQGSYFVGFQKAENSSYKSLRYFSLIVK